MKKFLLSASVIGVFALYSVHLNLGGSENPSVAVKTSNVIGSAFTSSNLQSSSAPSGGYKNGTYIGSVADAFYGNIQVQVTISGGRITDVKFLQFPSDRRTSQMINAQADPMLAQEAIQAQSANVSGVTGATASSGAFIQSLSSALQQAT
jgi:uncharacterized protein with FMN-binding domain